MLFISPPFGNYINLDNVISIKGSYTLYPRDGLFEQIIKTLRYSFENEGWINKIGLRNKGIDYAIENYDKKSVVSIAILDKDDIQPIVSKIPNNMNIELNVSCPNVSRNITNTINLSPFIKKERDWCIVKLSPLCDISLVDDYYKQGFRQFHCCNTIPIDKGGLSGKSIIPYSTSLISDIKKKYPDTKIIGGGGIKTMEDVNTYKISGADYFSISTLLFNPFKFAAFYCDISK